MTAGIYYFIKNGPIWADDVAGNFAVSLKGLVYIIWLYLNSNAEIGPKQGHNNSLSRYIFFYQNMLTNGVAK